MHPILHAVLITIAITAPAAALISNYIGYKLDYNLWDWLKDHTLALFGKVKTETTVIVKVATNEAHLVMGAISGAQRNLNWIIKRR